MKNIYKIVAICLLVIGANLFSVAQTKIKDGSVTGTGSLPSTNSILELESNSRGFMLPRMNQSEMEAITATEGLAIYNTTEKCIYIYAKGAWENLCNSNNYCGTVMVSDADNETDLMIDPNANGATFEPDTPQNECSIYITEDGRTWSYKNGTYITSVVKVQPWFDYATKKEATSINGAIYRMGSVNVGNSVTTGNFAFTTGGKNNNRGNNAIVAGLENQNYAVRNITFGYLNSNRGNSSLVGGERNTSTAVNGLVMGYNHNVTGNQGLTSGYENTVSANRAMVTGTSNIVSGIQTIVGGANNQIEGQNTSAWGYNNVATGHHAAVWGQGNKGNGNNTATWGNNNNMTGTNSATWGGNNTVSGNNSATWGQDNTNTATNSTIIGVRNTVRANNGVTIGVDLNINNADFVNSLVLGTGANANQSHQLTARFLGGYRFFTVSDEHATPALGVVLNNASNAWTSSSDRRFKTNIENLEYGLKTINALRPTSYNFKGQTDTSIGFIAQEVQEIIPEIVSNGFGEKGDYLGIRYTELIPVLTKAIQELSAKVSQLESENSNLKVQVTANIKEHIKAELTQILNESNVNKTEVSK